MEYFRHWFTPHHSNNHKAKTLHISSLTIILVLLMGCFGFIQAIKKNHPAILGYATSITVDELLKYTNEQRQKNGLQPLKIDERLITAANAKASYMFSHNYWAHTAPDGTTPWYFFSKAGYSYLHAGENLAKEFDTSAHVVDAWMDSPSHRANILRTDYQDVGFAVMNGTLQGQQTTLVVQMFGLKQSAVYNSTTANVMSQPGNTHTLGQVTIDHEAALTSFSSPRLTFLTISKIVAFSFGAFLLSVSLIDGLVLWRRGEVRMSSHNFAHVIFLISLLGALWFTGVGTVLLSASYV